MTSNLSLGRAIAHYLHRYRASLAFWWCLANALLVAALGGELFAPLLPWGVAWNVAWAAVWSAMLTPLLWSHHNVHQCPICASQPQPLNPPENTRLLRAWHRAEANTTISRLRTLGLFIMALAIANAMGLPPDPGVWGMLAVGVCALGKVEVQERHAYMRPWCPLCVSEEEPRETVR